MFTFIFINQTVPGNIRYDNHGNMIICTNVVRVITVTVLIRPNNFPDEQLRTIQRLAQAVDYSQQWESISVPSCGAGQVSKRP